jgi:very-short-patch-repair endonuclease
MQSYRRPSQSIFTTAHLIAAGHTRSSLRRDVARGALVPIRRGHYALPDAPMDLVRAVRLGGRAASTTALRHWGLWSAPDERLHVRLPPNAGRLRDPDLGGPFHRRDDVVLHWGGVGVAETDPSVESVFRSIITSARHEPHWHTVATIDSALHRRIVSAAELRTALSGCDDRLARCVRRVDAKAESGTESIARVRFADAGIPSVTQVWITPKIRVDLLIDGWLVVEIDGREAHGDADQSSRDYRRDAELVLRDHGVLHFDYGQVMFGWASVLDVTRATLFRGRDAALGLLPDSGPSARPSRFQVARA